MQRTSAREFPKNLQLLCNDSPTTVISITKNLQKNGTTVSSDDGGQYHDPQEELEAVEALEEKNRTILTYTIVGLVVVLVIVAIVVFAISRGDDGKKNAVSTSSTTTSTTEATTTSTTIPDPRQKYVGLEHDDRGAGLSLGTEIRSVGYKSGIGESLKNGDWAYFWVRDGKGDMLWLDQVTKASQTAEPIRSKVVAVWDLPTITDNQALCLGWCYDSSDKEDTSVIGLFDDAGAPLKAWRVDVTKPSFTSIPATGWKLYPNFDETPPLDIPERPALYGAVATANSDDRATYTAVEQVSAAGGATYGDAFISEVNDYKQNKAAAVSTKDTTVFDTVVTGMVDGASFNFPTPSNPVFKYDGKADGNVFAYASYKDGKLDKIYAAWRIDPKTYKMTALDKSKVSGV